MNCPCGHNNRMGKYAFGCTFPFSILQRKMRLQKCSRQCIAVLAAANSMKAIIMKLRVIYSAKSVTTVIPSNANAAEKDSCMRRITVMMIRCFAVPVLMRNIIAATAVEESSTMMIPTIHDDDTYWASDYPYCSNCYEEDDSDEDREYDNIHEYSYKPTPIFRRCTNEDAKRIRYYGVELEIDEGGKDDENAEDILYEANGDSDDEDMLYIKTDGSLNDGMELVSHPCSILYHRTEFPWKDITRKAKRLGYTSHNAGTCGLHVHISRDRLGESSEDQEETISRLMFFFESHWNELVKFSRRTEHALNQWAARYGYKDCPKEILENAKSSSKGRYASVNICNAKTVEIRMFRGTLKYNTLIATLEMVDAICENVICHTDDELHGQSWADFVVSINPEYIELIRYLKERQLYVNEPVAEEEEV